MSPHLALETVLKQLDDLFFEIMDQQRKKILALARVHYPDITGDDVLNPHDFQKLMEDPIFNYEEGLGSGFLAAHMAVRAYLLNPPQEQRAENLELGF
jgi:hypothetical protein